MLLNFRALFAASALLSLAGCAQQNPELPQLKSEITQLNQKLQRLTDVATALEQQAMLNRQSTGGIYLLPAANTPALLKTDFGNISFSISKIGAFETGSAGILTAKETSGRALPVFSAQLDWGQVDPVTGKPLTADMQTQTITVTADLLPSATQTLEIHLAHIAPEMLGFIRLHNVQPVSAQAVREQAASEAANLPASSGQTSAQ